MECPLYDHQKIHKHRKTSKGSQGQYCEVGRQIIISNLRYSILSPTNLTGKNFAKFEQVRTKVSSLRGVSRKDNLASNTVTIIKDSANRYFLSFVVEILPETLTKTDNSVDISKKDFPTTQGFQLLYHNEPQQYSQ